MKNPLLISLIVMLPFFTSCQNSYRQESPNVHTHTPSAPQVVGVSKDAFQVTVEEYGNYFESRYGLLYQKFNDRPFTGRILTIDKGASGSYVSSDESWKDGKKNGLSARWFSNGIKMYERNYSEGRWHGTVTRWWPNGQKMYIRAYTNGTRHGKEATWRSDGSPINLVTKPFVSDSDADGLGDKISFPSNSSVKSESNDLPSIDLPDTTDVSTEDPVPTESLPAFPETFSSPSDNSPPSFPSDSNEVSSEFPSFPAEPEPVESSIGSDSVEGFPPVPSVESPPSDFPAFPESPSPPLPSDSLPAFPPIEEGLPPLTGSDSVENDLPAFSDSLPENSDLAPLPGLPDSGGADLPPLPGLPDSGGDDLPPLPGLPGEDSSGGLPPLPGTESSDGSLPPLPAFPE